MNIETILTAAQKYYSEDYFPLLKHLEKCSNQMEFSTPEKHLPLLIFKTKDIYLWIKDEGVSDFPFLFTDPEEILFILYQYISTGGPVFISSELPEELTKEQIEKNIEKCLLEDDKEGFKYWIKLLKNND